MHLPEESDDCGNDATTGIRSAFSWDSRDTRADDLQMMDSIAVRAYFNRFLRFIGVQVERAEHLAALDEPANVDPLCS